MPAFRSVDKISWMPHPTATGVEIKPLITKREQGLDVTCMLVNVPRGTEVPVHIHDGQDDILYPMKGRARMWVEGTGEFALEPGIIVRVPKGVEHRIFDVREDLTVYDVFCPASL